MRTVETYRGIKIIQYQSQHHGAGTLSIGYVPPSRGKYGALEGDPIMTIDDVKEAIDRELKSESTSWNLEILKTETSQQKPATKLIKCSCGHTVPVILVMSASLGTSCPDCYDKISD